MVLILAFIPELNFGDRVPILIVVQEKDLGGLMQDKVSGSTKGLPYPVVTICVDQLADR